jgi:hypothetical protein
VRSNVDKVITFGQESLLERKALAEQYFSAIPQSEAFRLMDTYAFRPSNSEERYFLMFDASNQSGATLEERVYQGCAQDTPPFMLGTPEYWGTEYWDRIKLIKAAREAELDEEDDDSDSSSSSSSSDEDSRKKKRRTK